MQGLYKIMQKNSKIFVAGHKGMVGSALVKTLQSQGYTNLILKTRSELNLLNQADVDNFFKTNSIDYVFLAAAKVGGILANNTMRADFLIENLLIECNVIKASHDYKVKKLLFLGSSCIYPKLASQPIKEEYLLTGALEPTNEPYAIAKIAGLKLCQTYKEQYGDNFISVMPTNLYGEGDNFHLKNSHVLPALIRKCHEAKINNLPNVEIWGTGSALREFLHVSDLANACVYLMVKDIDTDWVNIGSSQEISIKNLALLIKEVVGYSGNLQFNSAYPDGTPRKLLDSTKINNLGWHNSIDLKQGIEQTYTWFLNNYSELNDR